MVSKNGENTSTPLSTLKEQNNSSQLLNFSVSAPHYEKNTNSTSKDSVNAQVEYISKNDAKTSVFTYPKNSLELIDNDIDSQNISTPPTLLRSLKFQSSSTPDVNTAEKADSEYANKEKSLEIKRNSSFCVLNENSRGKNGKFLLNKASHFHSKKLNFGSLYNRSTESSDATREAIKIRPFTPEDSVGVCSICRTHFRSLTFPAVTYYLIQHCYDFLAFLVIISIFLRFTKVLICIILFLTYLFFRAKIEFEIYIYQNCPDLADIYRTYMLNKRCHFWVAELIKPVKDGSDDKGGREGEGEANNSIHQSKKGDDVNTNNVKKVGIFSFLKISRKEILSSTKALFTGKLVGCIGLVPLKEDQSVAHLVRLVVAHESRRMRIGSRLLSQLETYAFEVGYKEVRLFTNNLNTSSLRFVRQSGYELQQVYSRGLMRGDLLMWRKVLIMSEEDAHLAETPLSNAERTATGVLD